MSFDMQKLTVVTIFYIFLTFTLSGQSSTYTIANKRAIALYSKAISAYDSYDYATAINLLNQSIKKEDQFVEAYLMLSQIYMEKKAIDSAIVTAEKAIAINPDYFPKIFYNLGNLLLYKGEYQKALDKFEHYRTVKPDLTGACNRKIQICRYALESLANPVDFNPTNLGDSINSKYDDYWPSLSADENTLVITVNIPRDPAYDVEYQNRQEDFFVSHRSSESSWKKVRPIGQPINTPLNEGAQSLTADGKRMFFTVCSGVCSIYRSNLQKDGTWGKPVKLPKNINHDRFSSKQPSISPDGRTLYFVSNQPGGIGDYDIWISIYKKGFWSKPKNLGSTINTEYEEQSPFIHFDNNTLYFASNGHLGMGGLDLYVTHMQKDSTWSEPRNLGYPINTFRDEDGLIVNAKGTIAYYSSNRGEASKRDIYTFALNPDVRPTPVSYLTGYIFNDENKEPVNAVFSLVDLLSEEEVMKSYSEGDDSYLVCIPTNKSYAFYASAPGFLFYSDHFDIRGNHSIDKPFRKDIALKPIKVDEMIVMKNIFFETNSYELKPESKVELNRLVTFLIENSTLRIEIGGHTDEVGTKEYNFRLSESRAKAVADFLISNSIPKESISWKGYGETVPVSNNTTDEGKAENRRTELRIIGM